MSDDTTPESVEIERLALRTGWLALLAGTLWEAGIVLFGLADPIYILGIAINALPLTFASLWVRFRPGQRYNRYIVMATGVLMVASVYYSLEDVSMFYVFLFLQAIAIIYQDRWLMWAVTIESMVAFTIVLRLRPEYLKVIAQFTGELWNGLSSIYFAFLLGALFYTTIGHVLIAHVKRLQSERLNREKLMTEQLAFSLSSALEARDPYTAGHSRRVAEYAAIIASHLPNNPLPEHEFRIACLLHDIGKIGVSDHVLRKRGEVTPDEWRHIQEHVEIGHRILQNVQAEQPIAEWVRCHHERIDGGGYPRSLAGDEIPFASRVMAVADALDAMTSDRPYRPGRTLEEVWAELQRLSGRQFDPDVVKAFKAALPEIQSAIQRDRMETPVRHQVAPVTVT